MVPTGVKTYSESNTGATRTYGTNNNDMVLLPLVISIKLLVLVLPKAELIMMQSMLPI